MKSVPRSVVNLESAKVRLTVLLFKGDSIVGVTTSGDYYSYNLRKGWTVEIPMSIQYDKCSNLQQLRNTYHWLDDHDFNQCFRTLIQEYRDQGASPCDKLESEQFHLLVSMGIKELRKFMDVNSHPRISHLALRVVNALASCRVSGDELTKGLKADGVDCNVKIQKSYLGGYNIAVDTTLEQWLDSIEQQEK